jgi:hypothetical protein
MYGEVMDAIVGLADEPVELVVGRKARGLYACPEPNHVVQERVQLLLDPRGLSGVRVAAVHAGWCTPIVISRIQEIARS